MTPTDGDVQLRRATPEDLPAVAEVFLAARHAAVPAMPPLVHDDDDVRGYVCSWDLDQPGRSLWVAERADAGLVGFAELKEAWLDDLYVHPGHQGEGLGSALLALAQAERPEGFCLWVFESNLPARAFYARHGLVTLERTDGSANEERAPDVKMAWPGHQPLAFFRRLIDEVDGQLGDLLARRVALTGAVQRIKAGLAESERDAEREASIAAALARRAPVLGEERLARIVHAIISESIDATRSDAG